MISWIPWAIRRAWPRTTEAEDEASQQATERNQAEDALRASEAKHRSLFENSMDAIFLTTPEGAVTAANPAACAMFGMTEQEICQCGRSGLLDPADPRLPAAMEERTRTGEINCELTCVRKDGTKFPAEVTSVNPRGSQIRSFIILRDLTERKRAEEAIRESEQRFRELVEQAPDAIVVHDLELDRWVSTNQSAEALFGYSREKLLEGGPLRFYSANQPDGRPPAESTYEHTKRALAGEQLVLQRAIRNGQGKDLICEVRLVRQTSKDRKLVRASYVDITERIRAEEEVLKAKEAAETANIAKDRFLAVLSHELRTPLTPALMIVAAHETDMALTAEIREDMGTVRRNLELEARLIDDLLDLNRLARGKIELHLQPGDLRRPLRDVVAICQAEIEAKNLTLGLELNATNHNVDCDSGRLQQVFWNLLKNSTKFTPAGGKIVVRSFNPRPGVVSVEVADTGMGINPQVIPRLFVAFEQGEVEITRRYGGLGLGLAICKAVMDLHGGEIFARSAGPGNGATFTVELPLTDGQVTPEYGPLPRRAADREPATSVRPLRILLVEDNADTSRILARLLEKTGCCVAAEKTVAGALAAVQAARDRDEPIDLIISDLGLPDGNGHDLMRQLREREDLVGIAISGYGTEEDIEKSHAAGFSEHFTKPIQFEGLQAAILRLARSS